MEWANSRFIPCTLIDNGSNKESINDRFYMGSFNDAYQSFLLSLSLFVNDYCVEFFLGYSSLIKKEKIPFSEGARAIFSIKFLLPLLILV